MPKGAPKLARSPKVWISDTWALEIAALVLSVVSLVAIVILLSVYDGEPQFSFGIINLNTIIAILAAAFRIGFMVPVGEALAQWKWLWFSKKSRPLADFDSIDDASRGSRGSLLLLWQTKGLSLTAIGAWVAILSLATEPFIQQLVNFRDTVVFEDDPTVSIPFARRWDGGDEVGSPPGSISTSNPTGGNLTSLISDYGTVRDIQLEQSAQAAVQFGLNSDAAAIAAQLPVNCPSGNCTWPSFLSLAVCSKCTDLSDMLKSSPKADYPMGWFVPTETTGLLGHAPMNLTQYSLPNGLNINNRRNNSHYSYRAAPVVATAFTDLRPSTSLAFQDASTLLFSTTILRVPDSSYPVDAHWPESPTIEAAECGIYLCIKEFESRVENGILLEKSREIASKRDPDSFNVYISNSACGGSCGTYNFRVPTTVDALFSNTTYFNRHDLSIKVPSDTTSYNALESVNVSQAGIDSLSDYIVSIFDEGTFKNRTVTANEYGPCSDDGTTVPCGKLHNISGMAAGPRGNPGEVETATGFFPAVMEQIWASPNLTVTFQNLATSITNEMRKSETLRSSTVPGQLGHVRTVLRVRWYWITLPGFLLLLSALFLLLTAIESNRTATPLWKGNALAVLYHGLEAKVRSTLEHWDLPSQMSDASEEVKVKLRRDPMDDVLLLRTGLDKTHSIPLMTTTIVSGGNRPSTPDQTHDHDWDDESSQIPLAAQSTPPRPPQTSGRELWTTRS